MKLRDLVAVLIGQCWYTFVFQVHIRTKASAIYLSNAHNFQFKLFILRALYVVQMKQRISIFGNFKFPSIFLAPGNFFLKLIRFSSDPKAKSVRAQMRIVWIWDKLFKFDLKEHCVHVFALGPTLMADQHKAAFWQRFWFLSIFLSLSSFLIVFEYLLAANIWKIENLQS